MMPNRPRRGSCSIDKKLVLSVGVELADPALRQGAQLVFHAAAGGWGDVVAGLMGQGIGGFGVVVVGAEPDGLVVGGGRIGM